MKRVVMVTTAHPWDDERIFGREARSLAEAGYQVVLAAPGACGRAERICLYPLHCWKSRAGRMLLGPLYALGRVLPLQGDIYHLHDPELIFTGLLLKMLGKQVVWDAHEDLPRQMMGKGWIPPGLRSPAAALAGLAEERAASGFDLCIGATERISRRLRKAGARAVTVENLPRPEKFLPQAPSKGREGLVYIGGIGERRGVFSMVEAARLSGMTLHLAGPVEPEGRAALLKAPQGQVRYHGVLGRAEVARLLSGCRIGLALLQPTPAYLEALPVKVLEYMAAGLPSVISDFPLWRRRFGPWGCALFADPEDPDDIARKIKWLAARPDECARMGRRGREAVIKHLCWDREAKKLLRAYEGLERKITRERRNTVYEPAADRPLRGQ